MTVDGAVHVAGVVNASGVRDRLLRSHAVVLERIARGAGATRWYWLEGVADVDRLVGWLAPGSVVSFYFDGRIGRASSAAELRARCLEIVAASGGAVVGRLGVDGLEIRVEDVAGDASLSEFMADVDSDDVLFVGAFPAADDDGTDAITLVVPDADGIVRGHPH